MAPVEGSSRLRWEYVGMARAEKARALFFRYRDKAFSFTDCPRFVVMPELSLREALTADHPSVQAGFTKRP